MRQLRECLLDNPQFRLVETPCLSILGAFKDLSTLSALEDPQRLRLGVGHDFPCTGPLVVLAKTRY